MSGYDRPEVWVMKTTMWLVAVLTILAAIPAAAMADREEIAKSLDRGWALLDIERKPAEAARVFGDVLQDDQVERDQKGEALLGLALCKRSLGEATEAAKLLALLKRQYGDLPEIARRLPALAGADGERTSHIAGTRILSEGMHLDLDTGGYFTEVRPLPGVEAEVSCEQGALKFRRPTSVDPAFADDVRWQSDRPWQRLVTSAGRTAWLQVLRAGRTPVLRFVTRIGSRTESLPAPRNPFCVGDADRIVVRFEPDTRYDRYRVERWSEAASTFETITEVVEPIFEDSAPPAGRSIYRVTGLTAEGDAGIPAVLAGAVNRRGVFSGSVSLSNTSPAPRIDFFTGRVVATGGDLTLGGTYGGKSGASFIDFIGQRVLPEPDGAAVEPSPWAEVGSWQIAPGRSFRVPLRGGGVARCRWEVFARGAIRLHFTVNPDAARFVRQVVLTASPTPAGVEVRATAKPGIRVESVVAADLIGDGEPRVLPIREGVALDVAGREGQLLRYSAVGEDKYGRRTAQAELVLNLMPAKPVAGAFSFHYQQGYSIERQKLVPLDQADVVFSSCAGGISSVTLTAPGGITSLRSLRSPEMERGRSVRSILSGLVGVVPANLKLRREARGDSRTLLTDIFVLRTRHGGWAKLAIVKRSERGGWTERPVHVRFVYNPVEPIFGGLTRAVEEDGFLLDPVKLEALPPEEPLTAGGRVHYAAAAAIRRKIADLDERSAAIAAAEKERFGRKIDVVALLNRDLAGPLGGTGPYVACTMSFEHATRDHLRQTRNDWDLQYGNGRGNHKFRVRTVTDDRSTIWDLGVVDFEFVPDSKGDYPSGDNLPVQKGHVYLIHTLDTETDQWAKVKVIEEQFAEWVIIRWKIIEDPKKFTPLERTPKKTMKRPAARLQLRGGAGGGNPNRAFLDGTTNAYVDWVAPDLIDMDGPVSSWEDCRAYVEGGYVPEGKVFVVNSVRYTARADGDSNGPGRFRLVVGGYEVVVLEKRRKKGQITYRTIGGESATLPATDIPLSRTLSCRVSIRPGQEKTVYAEIANSSLCDVVLEGEFLDEALVPVDPTRPANPAVAWFAAMLDHPLATVRDTASRRLVAIGTDALPYLAERTGRSVKADVKKALESVMEEIRGK